MLAGRPPKAIALSISVVVGIGATLALTVGSASAGTGPGASGNTITNALQAQTPFSPGTLDSGQPVDVVVPPNTVLTPGATIFVLECSAPSGVDPTTINSCDGNTGYAGGTISVNGDGSIDVINTSTSSGLPYIIYGLPDSITLAEGSSGPKCGLGSANECVLYIGQGGGSDTGLSQPHFFSQAFQVHPDPTDSGKLNPGDGTFPADSAPAITSANHTTFTKGTAGTFSVTASGYGPPTFTETGTLPTGVTLKTTFSGTSSTGVLAGTPTQSGTFPITITATNGVGSPATQSFTLTVNGPGTAPAITSANHTTFTEGTAGTFTVTATGSPTPTLAESGTLPTGVTFTPGTGKLAGTPTQSGSFPITFTATNGVGSPASQSFTLTVNGPGTAPAITSANHTTFTEGTAGTFTVTATGSPTPTLAESGTLPTGVTFTPGTGKLAGTPTQSGSFPITFTATNGVGSPASQSFTLTVNGPETAPAITSANHTTFTEGTVGTFTVTATGSPTPTLAELGTLPTGVTFTPSTGVLAGTPTVSGTFPITFTATNGVGSPASQSFTLAVDAAPVITSANHTTFTEGTAGTFTVTATGFPAPTFSETGTLPTGVLFSSSGVLSGTPTQSGPFPITVTATNGVGFPVGQSFTLTVNTAGTAPAITSANHSTFTEGTAGTFTVTATGSPTPTLAESGTLPTGVTFTPGTGKLAGTPTQSGSFPITFTATNGVGSPASQSFTLTVSTSGTAPAITSANHSTFTEGTAGTFTVTATGSPTPTLAESGTLPTGVTFTPGTGKLAGTPTQSGSFPITFTATNGVGSPASQSFTLTVSTSGTAPAITSANHTTLTEGTTGTFTVTATGSPTPTVAESGTLPTGVTFTPGTGKLAGTPTQSGSFPITFTATNGVGSPAHQSFTLTVNPSGSGPAITLHRTTDLVGNEPVAVSGTGWGADSMVTLSECTSPTFNPSSCDPIASNAGDRVAALEKDHRSGAGGRIRSHITLVVGVVGSKKRTCGLSSSGACYIVAVGNTGDSASIGPLRFSVPHFTLKHTQGLLGNTVDKVEASGFPIGDNVIAAECDPQVHVPKTVVGHCDQANSIQGSASSHGRVVFTPSAITVLVGSAFTDSAHRKCPAAGTCEIVVTDSDNPAIGLVAPITFAKPSVSLEASTNVSPSFKDKVDASGFPVGDGVIAQECDQSVHVPKTIGTHCDAATAVPGTVGGKGVVSFSPSAVTILVGNAYVDSSHHSCIPGGTCQVVVVDADNSNVAVGVPVGLAP